MPTDVPGHTRGLSFASCRKWRQVSGYRRQRWLHRPRNFRRCFSGKIPNGSSLVVMYHLGYGGTVQVPGSDLAVVIEMANDNAGPHSPDEVVRILFRNSQHRFPNADIQAASHDGNCECRRSLSKSSARRVTQEIGDTWTYGVSSDPLKVARYREVARLRQSWITQGKFRVGDATDVALLRSVGLEAEHTLGHGYQNPGSTMTIKRRRIWRRCSTPRTTNLSRSAGKKNARISSMESHGCPRRCAPRLKRRFAICSQRSRNSPAQLSCCRFSAANRKSALHSSALDPKTGAIHRLHNKKTGREWASADHPLALFSSSDSLPRRLRAISNGLHGHQGGVAELRSRLTQYRTVRRQKSGMAAVAGRSAFPEGCTRPTFPRAVGDLRDPEAAAIRPRRISAKDVYGKWFLPDAEPVIHLNFYAFQKPATRLPESLWLTFNPIVSNPKGWMLEKSGEQVSPFDVVRGGSRQMHAVSTQFSYKDNADGSFHRRADRLTAYRHGEKIAAEFLQGSARPLQRHAYQSVQQCLGNQLHHVVWRGHALPLRVARLTPHEPPLIVQHFTGFLGSITRSAITVSSSKCSTFP